MYKRQPIGPGTYTNIFNTLNPNLLKESGKEVYVDSLFFNLASTYNVTVFATNAPDTSLPTGFSFRRVDLIADKVTGLEDFTWINGVDDATAVSYTHLDVYKRQIANLGCYWTALIRQAIRIMQVILINC